MAEPAASLLAVSYSIHDSLDGRKPFCSHSDSAVRDNSIAAALTYWLLQRAIMNQHAGDSSFVMQMGKDWKGKLSPLLYLLAVLTAYASPWISGFLFALVAAIWFVPDKRIEQALGDR
ncbi:hypothetical protein BN871_AA_00260 [Paenibacillus sp. P22]|nr:hypothetical protein [Paenibacillus sp. P22]CDN41000.1 hypothetical protein BN871_AA_00260 [Paenibacillus sp. P22]